MNSMKSPVVSLLCLDAKALQPNPPDNYTEEFDDYQQDNPELFNNYVYNDNLPECQFGQLPNLAIINVSAESGNYQPLPQPLRNAGPPSTVPSSVGISIHSSRLGEYINDINIVTKQGIFNVILDNIPIMNHEVQKLLDVEKVALKMIHNVERAVIANKTCATIKPLWKKLHPLMCEFIASYDMVSVLSHGEEELTDTDLNG